MFGAFGDYLMIGQQRIATTITQDNKMNYQATTTTTTTTTMNPNFVIKYNTEYQFTKEQNYQLTTQQSTAPTTNQSQAPENLVDGMRDQRPTGWWALNRGWETGRLTAPWLSPFRANGKGEWGGKWMKMVLFWWWYC